MAAWILLFGGIPFGVVIALFAWFGLYLSVLVAGMLLLVSPVLMVLAWLANQIPYLPLQAVGRAFRNQGRPRP